MRLYVVKIETESRQPDGNYYRSVEVLADTPRAAVSIVKSKTGRKGRAYLAR